VFSFPLVAFFWVKNESNLLAHFVHERFSPFLFLGFLEREDF